MQDDLVIFDSPGAIEVGQTPIHTRPRGHSYPPQGGYNHRPKTKLAPKSGVMSGAGAAVDVAGTTFNNSLPWRPLRVLGFWSMSIGMFTVGGIIWNGSIGLISGVASNRPLPANAPTEMRFTHAAAQIVKPVGYGVVQGVDNGVRVQLTGSSQTPNQAVPTRISTSNATFTPVVPVANWQQGN